MLPKKLKIKDFMSHKDSFIDFSLFSSCLIMAVNKNDSQISNGIGKTTIFRAITYVLFDEYETTKVEKIIRDGADGCEVEFEFEADSQIYKVIRGRSKSGPHLYLKVWNDKWEDISQKTNTQTQNELLKIIKISYVSWKHSVLFAQGDLEGIPFASSDKRKELLKEPLQIMIYGKYYKFTKKKLDEKLKEQDKCNTFIEILGSPQNDIDSILKEIDIYKNNLINFNKQKENIESNLNSNKLKLTDLQNISNLDSSGLQVQLLNVKKQKISAEKDINSLVSDIMVNNKKLTDLKDNLKKKLDTLQSKKDDLKRLRSESLQNPEHLQKEIDSFITKEQQGRVYLAKLASDKAQFQKPVPDNGMCNNCFQDITDHEACIIRAKDKLTHVLAEQIKYEDMLNKCIYKRKQLEQEQKGVSFKLTQISSLDRDVNSFESVIRTDQESLLEYDSIILSKKTSLEKLNITLDALNKNEEELTKIIKKTNIIDLNDKIMKVSNDIKNNENELNNINKNITTSETMIDVLEERKQKKEIDLLHLNARLDEKKVLGKEIGMIQRVVKAFGSAGIPHLIIQTVLDDLQTEVNKILSELRPNIQCKFNIDNEKDTWDIIYYIYGVERDQALLSGGQKLFIALSFKLALSKIIQRRVGTNIRFLLFDEVDSTLDESGVISYSEVIKGWQDKFKILAITHNKLLKTKFSNVVLVEGNDGEGSVASVQSN